jgi:hypothetical protein
MRSVGVETFFSFCFCFMFVDLRDRIGLAVKFKLFVPAVVHACPKPFWDMEVIVFVRVIAFWFIIFALFRAQIIDLFNYCE